MDTITIIASAVLNTFWQSMVLALLVWLSIKLLQPRVNAATRYVIWWIALAVMIALPLVPQRGSPPAPRVPSMAPSAAVPARVSAPLLTVESAPVIVMKSREPLWPLWVFAIWVAAFAYRSIAITRSYFYLRGLKHRSVPSSETLPGVRRPARLLVSTEISSPIAVGFWRPAVILPKALSEKLSTDERLWVVLHESAHLARYDDWANALGRMAGAVLGLHPVAWWILRQIDQEREFACDDWVVARKGAARHYAESLVRILELRVAPTDSVLASGILTGESRLYARIESLLRKGRRFCAVPARGMASAAGLALIVLGVAGSQAPRWVVFAQRLEFEVAAVKPNATNGRSDGSGPRRDGDFVAMHNAQVYSVIYYAFHLNGNYQMVGYKPLPEPWGWVDIDAKASASTSDDQIRLMFQSLLEDRFKLKVHREMRDLQEYELTVAGSNARLAAAREGPFSVTIEGRTINQRPDTCSTTLWQEGAHIVCHAVGMNRLAAQVGAQLQSPVVNRTDLTGSYDLNIIFVPEDRRLRDDAPFGASLPDALQDQLGLKLVKGTGPVEVLVIDHLEKPTEN